VRCGGPDRGGKEVAIASNEPGTTTHHDQKRGGTERKKEREREREDSPRITSKGYWEGIVIAGRMLHSLRSTLTGSYLAKPDPVPTDHVDREPDHIQQTPLIVYPTDHI
jgi:hypothetical protein